MALEREKNKLVLEKCQNLLADLLKDEDNKYCVDCDAKSPRWASWNIGIFLCIRCAGIHRNLGVHISKVKSVNLDAWTPQQVACIQQMGNSRARAVYEANLQDNFRRPQTDSSLEQFIRAKYEAKKYIAKEWVPPPMPNPTWDIEIEKQLKKKKEKKISSGSVEFAASVKSNTAKSGVSPKPLPKAPGGRNSSSPNQKRTSGSALNAKPKENKEVTNSSSVDLLGLDAQTTTTNTTTTNGTAENDGDIFGDFLTAPSIPVSSSSEGSKSEKDVSHNDESSFFNQKLPEPSSEKLSKDSILALYSQTPPNPQPQVPTPQVFGVGGMYMGQPGIPIVAPTGMGMVPPQHQQNMMAFQQKSAGAIQPSFYPQGGVPNMGGQIYSSVPTTALPQGMPVGMQLSAANPFAQMQAQMGNLNLGMKTGVQTQPQPQQQPQQQQQVAPVPNPLMMINIMGAAQMPPNSSTTQSTTLSSNLWQ